MQIPARTPTMTAMTAATLDTLSDGRFRLGLGVSGPQVSEGWHGVRFDKPLARTREYVDIVNLALARKKVRYDGSDLPAAAARRPGQGAAPDAAPGRASTSRSTWPRSARRTSSSPARSPTAGCRCSSRPATPASSSSASAAGRAKAGKDLTGFDVAATVPIVGR